MNAAHLMNVAEAAGAVSALVGAWLLALRLPYSHWGWVAYLVSNMCWLVFAILIGRWWLLLQTMGFIISSLVGVWNFCISPGRKRGST
jgi:hypothetical protein